MSTKGGGAPSRSSTPVPDPDQALFGDAMEIYRPSIFRITFLNPGGFPVHRKNFKTKIIEEKLCQLNVSVLCFSETNVNWNKVSSYERLHERFYGWWRRCSLNIAHYASYGLKQLSSTSPHQFGGVALCSIDDGAARVHSSGTDPTGLGRWAWTRYQGKQNHGLRVVVAYRCNRDSGYAGLVYHQQKAYFDSIGQDRNPREAFWHDLQSEILPWLSSPDHIVVCLDANDDVRDCQLMQYLVTIGL